MDFTLLTWTGKKRKGQKIALSFKFNFESGEGLLQMSATAKGVPSSGRDLRQVDASVLCGYATLIIRFVCIIIYIPGFTRRDKDRLFALEKPADWSYDFFTSEKRRIDVLIGYIIISLVNKTVSSLAAPLG